MAVTAEPALGDSPVVKYQSYLSSLALNISLRFVLLYLFLSNWIWLDNLAINPTRPIRPVFDAIFGPLTRWTGRHLFHLSGHLQQNAQLDTRYLYVLMFVLAVVSVVLTVAWTIIDRTRRSTDVAYAVLRVWIRYTLAYVVLIYGMNKVFPIQFESPSLRKLIQPFGGSSPMMLLWTYMGYSQFVEVCAGLAEVTGAALLLFRRTAPLGALISVVMMANVALMDFSYDVSVKMLAAHCLAMGIFLLSHDAKRLLAVLAFNRPAPAGDIETPIVTKGGARTRRFLKVAKILVALYVLVPVTIRSYREYRVRYHRHQRAPLYGLYELGAYTVNGQDHPLVVTEPKLWRYVIMENVGVAAFVSMDDSLTLYDSKYDAASSALKLQARTGTSPAVNLAISPPPSTPIPGDLLLTGEVGQDHVSAVLRRVDPQNFTLIKRGFHWINEASFNR